MTSAIQHTPISGQMKSDPYVVYIWQKLVWCRIFYNGGMIDVFDLWLRTQLQCSRGDPG